jgi:hypothetical protein
MEGTKSSGFCGLPFSQVHMAFGLGFYTDSSKFVAHPLHMSKLPSMHVKWSKDSILETLK